MPICLECGFTAPRLQWTHFKYKCTNRFNNGTEYLKVYPNAILVDSSVTQKTKLTLTNFIVKYGEVDGTIKWNNYREKQAKSNSFEYKHEKFGWTREQYDDYNSSRAITLENQIKKHGESQGIANWLIYCDRQAYTNTEQYFIEKYGEVDGRIKFLEVNAAKSHCVETVMIRNSCSDSEASTIIANYKQSEKYSSNLERTFIDDLEKQLGEPLEYSCKTKQYCIWANNRINFYDIVHNNRAIEFNGDYWHCNPLTYLPNYYHKHADVTSCEIWEKDRLKIEALQKDRSIDTLVIWESDFAKDHNNILKRCVEWLKQNDKK